MKDNIYNINKITWYDIYENGSINGKLNKQPAIYIFMYVKI